MDRPLKIAHCVELYHPTVGGMQEVVRQLSERMVKLGHHVTVFTSTHPERQRNTSINGVEIRSFAISGHAGATYHGETEAYWSELQNGHFDVVTLFAAQQWTADLVLQKAGQLPAKKVFVPTGFSRLHDPALSRYYAQMPGWLKKMDLIVFLSHNYQDIEFARAHGVTTCTVIPNGAAEEEFSGPLVENFRKTYGIREEQQVLLHLGSYSGFKGHEEAIRIHLAARNNAVLVLIGNGIGRLENFFKRHIRCAWMRILAKLNNKRIVFLDLDRPRTINALRQADLFLFPSRIECSPIVLFEAMAAGVPFLASPAGNAAEIVEWSHGGWIMPGKKANGIVKVDIVRSADLLDELLSDRRILERTGAMGHAAWQHQFTWQRIAEQYLKEYQRLVNG